VFQDGVAGFPQADGAESLQSYPSSSELEEELEELDDGLDEELLEDELDEELELELELELEELEDGLEEEEDEEELLSTMRPLANPTVRISEATTAIIIFFISLSLIYFK
jgi:predicted nuclease with TOPRIM domain